MNIQEFEEVRKYLSVNNIEVFIDNAKNISYEEVMVWNDLTLSEKYNYAPKGLTFTGKAITDFSDKKIFEGVEIPLSEDFIRKFKDKVSWLDICYFQTLSENFIREFKDKVNWYSISSSQTLSESFIREFQNSVNWAQISYCQTLSEDFIREFKDKLHWGYISIKQSLSEKFKKEFRYELNEHSRI
jgi:hypothetical protein